MLKAEIRENDGKTSVQVEIAGDIKTLCTDLSVMLGVINTKMNEINPALGHTFRVMFTSGFMDGVCFDDDREHMEHYLAEGRESQSKTDKANDVLAGLREFLKSQGIDVGDDDDEAK